MRFNQVGFILAVGMALIVVLFGFTLLSAGGLVGFAAADVAAASARQEKSGNAGFMSCGVTNCPAAVTALAELPVAEANAMAVGDALFKANCAQCHAVNEQVVGPALAGITRRRPVSWLLPWVKNSSKVVASGDAYAGALYSKFNKQQMPSFALSDKEITAIVAYITWQEGGMMQVVVN